jgi:hypothetical protein
MPTRARYLAVTAIIKNEGPYLQEWIAFQRLMGAEQVYLYDHGSTDDSAEIVAPFVREGFVTLIPWASFDDEVNPQRQAYAHALCNFGPEFRWMAFIDLDEFLFPVKAPDLVSVLRGYEDCPSVCVPWFMFGFSGHEKPVPGLVIENYTQRAPFPPTADPKMLLRWKSVVNPAAVVAVSDVHMFKVVGGTIGGVDERRDPVFKGVRRDPPPASVLRINHYYTRSRLEFAEKSCRNPFGTLSAGKRQRRADLIEAETVRDETILRFLPALRERMQLENRVKSSAAGCNSRPELLRR